MRGSFRPKYVKLRVADHANVAARWEKQYEGYWMRGEGADKKLIHEQILTLGETASDSDIDRIIGNKSWTNLSCDGCGGHHKKLVEIGEYTNSAYCQTCITEALALLEGDKQ